MKVKLLTPNKQVRTKEKDYFKQFFKQSILLNVNPVGFDQDLGTKKKMTEKNSYKSGSSPKRSLKKHCWADLIKPL